MSSLFGYASSDTIRFTARLGQTTVIPGFQTQATVAPGDMITVMANFVLTGSAYTSIQATGVPLTSSTSLSQLSIGGADGVCVTQHALFVVASSAPSGATITFNVVAGTDEVQGTQQCTLKGAGNSIVGAVRDDGSCVGAGTNHQYPASVSSEENLAAMICGATEPVVVPTSEGLDVAVGDLVEVQVSFGLKLKPSTPTPSTWMIVQDTSIAVPAGLEFLTATPEASVLARGHWGPNYGTALCKCTSPGHARFQVAFHPNSAQPTDDESKTYAEVAIVGTFPGGTTIDLDGADGASVRACLDLLYPHGGERSAAATYTILLVTSEGNYTPVPEEEDFGLPETVLDLDVVSLSLQSMFATSQPIAMVASAPGAR